LAQLNFGCICYVGLCLVRLVFFAMCDRPVACGYHVGEEIRQNWDTSVIGLTMGISFCGAFTSLTICGHLRVVNNQCWYWIFLVGAGLGVGVNTVWAMHFVGMSALHLDGGMSSGASGEIPFKFEASFTIISAFAAWLIATMGLRIVAGRDASKRGLVDRELWQRLAVGASLIATGVVVMHYMGMFSETGPFHMEYDPGIVFLSGLIALVAAAVGLFLLMTMPPAMKTRFAAATLIAVAVNGMHYTGMQAATYTIVEEDVYLLTTATIHVGSPVIGVLVLIADLALYAICDSYGIQMRK